MADMQTVSPYARRTWQPQEEIVEGIPWAGGLKLATFGWWEIVLPTQQNYTRLQNRLLIEGIHICAVTGLPAQHLGSGLQEGSYFWEGPVVDNHQAVGILIHKCLREQTSPCSMVPGTENRAVVVSVGQCIAQAVYSPFMGKVLAAHTKNFLANIALNHRKMQDDHRDKEVWTMGDFNLQGLAPGHQDTPAQGSQHHVLSQWMRQLLEANGLQVVKTPATHTGGTALDVHITEQASRYEARGYTFPKKLSDHSLSMVDTDIPTGAAKSRVSTKPQPTYQQVAWSKDVTKWKQAYEGVVDLTTIKRGYYRS